MTTFTTPAGLGEPGGGAGREHEGRVAIVTGSTSGIGLGIAEALAARGAAVVLNGFGPEAGIEATCRRLAEAHAVPVRHDGADMARPDEIARLVERTARAFGPCDILVNNAGIQFVAPVDEFPEEKFDFIVGLNLKGTYLCCQAFGRKMLDQGKGSIINLGSIGAFIGYPWASAYLASKGGVLGVTRGLALEWRDRGVRVNAIGPTLMDSPLTRQVAQTTSLTADFIKARMLRPRLGLPRELIGAAVFLASDAAELVTGHTLMCDDGYLTA